MELATWKHLLNAFKKFFMVKGGGMFSFLDVTQLQSACTSKNLLFCSAALKFLDPERVFFEAFLGTISIWMVRVLLEDS